MRQLDNMTPEELDILRVKGMYGRNPGHEGADKRGDRQAEKLLAIGLEGETAIVWSGKRETISEVRAQRDSAQEGFSQLAEAHDIVLAERDKLREQCDRLLKGYNDYQRWFDESSVQVKQLREQVRELLAACKDAAQFINDNHSLLANVKANAMDCQLQAALEHTEEAQP
jgi:glycerol-3-phosphate O-acyltransferase